MRIAAAFCFWSQGALVEECLPAILPALEGAGKMSLFQARKGVCQKPELARGQELWIACEVAPDDGYLVELAHLDGDGAEGAEQAAAPVANHGLNTTMPLFQLVDG